MIWEHPLIRRFLLIGNEVRVLPDALQTTPSPSLTNPIYRSVETSETKTLAEWQSDYVITLGNGQNLIANQKNSGNIPLTLVPIPMMGQ
jgi:hypothetical protein